MPQSIRQNHHQVHREVDHALEGDQILIECRKHGTWETARGSERHHYFITVASKNAYAVLKKSYTNVRD